MHVLLAIWWAGAAAGTIAILLPKYDNFLAVGIAGWTTLFTCSGLMLHEIRRIKKEDRKKKQNELV